MLQLLLGAAIAGGGFVGVYWPGSVESFFGVLGLLMAVWVRCSSSPAYSGWEVRSRRCRDRAHGRACGRVESSGSCVTRCMGACS